MHIPSEQAIRERAYQLWENDGRPDGHSVDYWLEAARQLEDEGSPAPEKAAGKMAAVRRAVPSATRKPPGPGRKPKATAKKVAPQGGAKGSVAAKGLIPAAVRNAP